MTVKSRPTFRRSKGGGAQEGSVETGMYDLAARVFRRVRDVCILKLSFGYETSDLS